MSLVPKGTDTSGMEQAESDPTGPSKAKQILEGLSTLSNQGQPSKCATCGGPMADAQIKAGGLAAPGIPLK